MNDDKLRYTTINHAAREQLQLSWLEYGLADLINRLASNPKSQMPGWCYASKETLADNLGITKQGIHKLINRLITKGLIEKHPITKHLKITIDWYKSVEIMDSKQSLPPVNVVSSDSKQSLLQTVNKVYTRIERDKEKENTITNVIEEFGNSSINSGIKLLASLLGNNPPKMQLNRFAVKRLYKTYGEERTLKALQFAFYVKDMKYAPQIYNFLDLEEKWARLEGFARRKVNSPNILSMEDMQ